MAISNREKEVRDKAYEEWKSDFYTVPGTFDAGFTAGLAYNQARVEELEALIRRLIDCGGSVFEDALGQDKNWHWRQHMMDFDKLLVDCRKKVPQAQNQTN